MQPYTRQISPAWKEPPFISEDYLLIFSKICIVMLVIFSALNAYNNFWIAVIINLIGILLYLGNLFIFRITRNIYFAGTFCVFVCSYIIFGQSVILEADAYHNLFFYPPVGVFCFALFDKGFYTALAFAITCIGAIASFLVPKYFDTTQWYLAQADKDFYLFSSVLGSLIATYFIGKALYSQKSFALIKLQHANEKLEMINKKNKSLLQIIIHDISNPLVAMDFAIKAVGQTRKSDENFKTINRVCDPAILTIREIIESAREMMALEDGKIATNLTPTCLKSTIEETVHLLEGPLEKKGITIKRKYLASPDSMALLDPKSFKSSVLMNLLTNAIKFSHRNSEVKVETSEDPKNLIVKVIDTGIGIPENIQDKIFSPIEKTTRPGTEGEPGTGYGMPLAKAFMDSYGGTIQCVSEEGIGTLIKLTLPKAPAHA